MSSQWKGPIMATIIFGQVYELLVDVVKLGEKGFQIQEMGTGAIIRKILSAKCFLSEQDRC